jgi:hypothetical protein
MRANLISGAAVAVFGLVVAAVVWRSSVVSASLAGLAGPVIGGGMIVATLRRQPHTPWAEARDQLTPDRAIAFWKPTCRYCTALRRSLREDSRIVWVNVWVDADANREVRSYNHGDEYTPTVLVRDQVLRNPSADEVRTALG